MLEMTPPWRTLPTLSEYCRRRTPQAKTHLPISLLLWNTSPLVLLICRPIPTALVYLGTHERRFFFKAVASQLSSAPRSLAPLLLLICFQIASATLCNGVNLTFVLESRETNSAAAAIAIQRYQMTCQAAQKSQNAARPL